MSMVQLNTDDYTLDDLMGLNTALVEAEAFERGEDDTRIREAWEAVQTAFYARPSQSPTDVWVKLIALNAECLSDDGIYAEPIYREALAHLPRNVAAHLRESLDRADALKATKEKTHG